MCTSEYSEYTTINSASFTVITYYSYQISRHVTTVVEIVCLNNPVTKVTFRPRCL